MAATLTCPPPRLPARLAACTAGATIVEFALVVPLFLMLVMAIFDAGMGLYANAVLQGTMQKVGREFSLEDAESNQARLEGHVTEQVTAVTPGAQVSFARQAYFDFGDIGRAEQFDDINANGQCDNNEPFEDVNGNARWDTDRGREGFGGARDAMVLTATVRYHRLFPLTAFFGGSDQLVMRASSVLRNQPFDEQNRELALGNCA